MDGSDIAYGMKQGYIYNTWVVDDDNAGHADITENSITFKEKKEPEFVFKKNNTYVFTYTAAKTGAFTSEAGSYAVDVDAKTITFHPSGKTDYTFKITCLTQENFTWVATNSQTSYIKNDEGTLVPHTSQTDETLYMEDND